MEIKGDLLGEIVTTFTANSIFQMLTGDISWKELFTK